jgi:hypothetical protein
MTDQAGGIKGLLRRCSDVSKTSAMPWIAIGIAFLVLGVSGSRAFLALGIAFLAIGLAYSRRTRGRA